MRFWLRWSKVLAPLDGMKITPFLPPSGPAQRLFQGPHRKSNSLALASRLDQPAAGGRDRL